MAVFELRRSDSAKNCFRRYRIADQPNLLGGADLVLEWGRVGRKLRSKVEHFSSHEDLARRRTEVLALRKERGYQLVAVSAGSGDELLAGLLAAVTGTGLATARLSS